MDRNQDRKAATTPKSKAAATAQARSPQMTSETTPGSQGPASSPSRKAEASSIAGTMVAPVPPQDDGSRESRIAREAYYRAERRGFQPGNELDDWLEAEKELEKRQQH